jgi:small subunit ribosomal protein SAe
LPADGFIIFFGNTSQQAMLLFAAAVTRATPIAASFIPGTLTNQIQTAFMELPLLVATDPTSPHLMPTCLSRSG